MELLRNRLSQLFEDVDLHIENVNTTGRAIPYYATIMKTYLK